jgi:tetratricopeptide (TPR) repeat protein
MTIVMIYAQVGTFDFVDFDDGLYVTENSFVQRGLTKEGFVWAFISSHTGNWHPMTWLSHMLDSELYGLNPAGHHYTNIGFHIANTLFLFFILFRLTEELWKSAFVAALFAVHPLHVESVAWISERKDVLSTFFGLFMIYNYDRYVKISSLKNYLLVLLFFGLGLMSKPMLVSLPLVLLLLDFWPLKRIQLQNNFHLQTGRSTFHDVKGVSVLVVEKIPLFVLSGISSILTFIVQKSGGAVAPLLVLPLKTRIANALISYVRYFFKMVWPHKLAYYYPYPIGTFSTWQICGAALLLICAVLGAMYLARQYPYVPVGLFWYLGTLVPVIGLVQISDQAMADRYTYIPLVGLFIVIAWGIPDILKKWQYRKIFLCVSAVIILSALTTRAFFQAHNWKNSILLFRNAVKVTENNFHALNNLATALADKGRYDDAFLYLSRAKKMDPQREDVRINYANVLFLKGMPDEAISQYREILQADSENADVHYNLAYVLSFKKKYTGAVFHYKETLRIDPKNSKAHYNLGNILLIQEKTKEAITHFAEAIKINPDYVDAYNKIGSLLFQKGKLNKAKVFFLKAIQIDPNNLEAQKNLNTLNQMLSQKER